MSPARASKIKRMKPSVFYRRVAFTFIGFAFLFIAIILYFSSVSVQIVITPKTQNEHAESLIEVSADKKDMLSAQFFEVENESTQTFAATGKKKLEGNVLGTIVITNTSNTPQPLVATTRLQSAGGQVVRMKDAATVPAKGSVSVDVYPHEDSEAFFAADGFVSGTFTIPGLSSSRQKEVFGETKNTLKYGNVTVSIVLKDDVDRALESLTQQVHQKSVEQVTGLLGVQDEKYLVLSKLEITQSKADAKEGVQAENFQATVKVKSFGVVMEKKQAIDAIAKKLSSSLSQDKELIFLDPRSFQAVLDRFDGGREQAWVKMSLSGKSSLRVSKELFDKSSLVGKNKQELVDFYEDFENIKKIEIRFFPFWVKHVPNQLDHIEIYINKPEAPAEEGSSA